MMMTMVVHFEPLMRSEVVGLVNQCPSRLQCLRQIGFLAMWNQTPFPQPQKVIRRFAPRDGDVDPPEHRNLAAEKMGLVYLHGDFVGRMMKKRMVGFGSDP